MVSVCTHMVCLGFTLVTVQEIKGGRLLGVVYSLQTVLHVHRDPSTNRQVIQTH